MKWEGNGSLKISPPNVNEVEGREIVLNLICWFIDNGGGGPSTEDVKVEQFTGVVSIWDFSCCIGGG